MSSTDKNRFLIIKAMQGIVMHLNLHFKRTGLISGCHVNFCPYSILKDNLELANRSWVSVLSNRLDLAYAANHRKVETEVVVLLGGQGCKINKNVPGTGYSNNSGCIA